MAKQILTIAAVSAALIFSSCASNNVSRVSSETVTDLSGYWNDTDVRLVAGEIIDGCLASPRIAQYPSQHGGKLPVVIVGSYRNKSDEHIDTEILTKKLEAALVNSGKVEFVASSAERNELRAERIDQQTNASESTVCTWNFCCRVYIVSRRWVMRLKRCGSYSTSSTFDAISCEMSFSSTKQLSRRSASSCASG